MSLLQLVNLSKESNLFIFGLFFVVLNDVPFSMGVRYFYRIQYKNYEQYFKQYFTIYTTPTGAFQNPEFEQPFSRSSPYITAL